jgi:hypothetical protein
LVDNLRKSRVVGLLAPDTPLDEGLVDRLVRDYPLVFVAVDPDDPPAFSDRIAYQMLDPDVDDKLADRAFMAYDHLRADLSGPAYGKRFS